MNTLNLNWYKLSQLSQLSTEQPDTRSAQGRAQAGKMILNQLGGLNIGDILIPATNVSGNMAGRDNTYQVTKINPDFTVDLLAMETQRPMPNSQLYGLNARQQLVSRWMKSVKSN
jgi:hypothetical protein